MCAVTGGVSTQHRLNIRFASTKRYLIGRKIHTEYPKIKLAQKPNITKILPLRLSFLVPSFVSAALYEEDALVQIEVDDSRSALYTRSEKGVLSVFDLGRAGDETQLICSLTQQQIVQEAAKVAQ